MNDGWIIFGLCVLTLVGATLPLLHEKHRQRKTFRDQQPSLNTNDNEL